MNEKYFDVTNTKNSLIINDKNGEVEDFTANIFNIRK